MNRDMTKGSPMKTIVGFTIPIFIGNVFQQFYSMVDTVVVGQFVGTGALAAVGSTGTIMFLILGFLMGFSTGVTVLTGQRFGAGDLAGMRKTVASSVVLSAIVSIVMTAVSMLCMRRLLILMNTPENVFYDAYSYIMIICGGIVAQVAYNLLACLLRALGNSRVPLYFLILAAFLNVVLDLVFIIVFHMGTAGAAWATVISQGVSALLCLLYIVRCVPELWLKKEDWKFPMQMVRTQVGVGLPMAFQFSITAIGTDYGTIFPECAGCAADGSFYGQPTKLNKWSPRHTLLWVRQWPLIVHRIRAPGESTASVPVSARLPLSALSMRSSWVRPL